MKQSPINSQNCQTLTIILKNAIKILKQILQIQKKINNINKVTKDSKLVNEEFKNTAGEVNKKIDLMLKNKNEN